MYNNCYGNCARFRLLPWNPINILLSDLSGRGILVVYSSSLLDKENQQMQWFTHAKDNKFRRRVASRSQRIWRKKATSIQACVALGRVHTCSGSRSGPVPLVRVAFTPAKIDRTCSCWRPVTRSHLFWTRSGTRSVSNPGCWVRCQNS